MEQLSAFELLYCSVVLVLAYGLRGSTGFGSTVGLPFLALIIPIKVLVPVWTLLGIASSISILGRDRKHVTVRPLLTLLPGCLAGVALGLFVFATFDAAVLSRGLGMVVLMYAAYALWQTFPTRLGPSLPPQLIRPIASVLSGAVGTAFGAMATLFFAMYLDSHAIAKNAFRATISAMLLVLSLIRMIAYSVVGAFNYDVILVFVAALPLMLLGIYLGGHIHSGINEVAFRRLVCGVLALCAVPLLLK